MARGRLLLRLGSLALIVGLLALASSRLPLAEAAERLRSFGAVGPAAGILLGAVLLMVLIPRTALSLVCGVLFGALAGAAVALSAAVLAAVATFWLGRWAGRRAIAARLGGRWSRIDGWLAQRGVLAVVVVRLLPIAPFGLMGYAYGTSSTRFRHYVIGTAIGATPSAFANTAIGAAVVSPHGATLLTYAPAAISFCVMVGATLYWRYSGRSRHPETAQTR
ncbi:TVP38/TMEM64 family protein [Hamadaea tsunoensis]|uniref:TVP38/TMEM64 family protein n=1 Tax=Hamadaea tsunoensis TaxID=53368 RepID=UPI0004289194|nr:VTT domain-containing protein [Hamadaea tsunoensis]